ncbi:MAG: hypothetical protein KGD63_01410 [Candidatus Lokiarchaeota archaeon]|nr:hypothetical protein [Candidatus Lokiarchaeota archaeon]
MSLIKKSLSPSDFKYFQDLIKNAEHTKTIVGQNLGTHDLLIILPKN